jgi:transcriptional regulator with XRE-family HTH domain
MSETIKNQLIVLMDSTCKYDETREKNVDTICKTLKNKRIELNLTREYIAQKLEISEDDIFWIERGISFFSKSDIELIYKLIYFYFDENHENQENKNLFIKDEKVKKK